MTESNINFVNDCTKNKKEFISVRDIERTTGIKRQSVHNILTQELKLFPYEVQIGQKLTPNSMTLRKFFCENMLKKIESDPEFLNNIWFTDERCFNLNGYVNKQNMRIWGSENPNLVLEKSAHSSYVTVWAAISYSGMNGPYFFENSEGV